jgi:hypothetical protein
MVLEHADGTVIGIEVTAAETVHSDDFRGLPYAANRLGDRLHAGMDARRLDLLSTAHAAGPGRVRPFASEVVQEARMRSAS